MATARAPKAGARRAGTKRKERKNVPHGVASIAATFNNTIVAITDPMGNILSWSSAGRIGFKGSRKGTPFAAQVAAQNAAQLAQEHGIRSVDVKVKGPGAGRESAVRAIQAVGIEISVIHPRPCGERPRHQVDQGRYADSAQRLPPTQTPPRLIISC